MRRSLVALAVALCVVAGGSFVWADEPAAGEAEGAQALTPAEPSANVLFRFAIMSDRGGGIRRGVFESAIPKLNMLSPDFVMCVGDLIEGYTEDPAEMNAEWDELTGILGGLEMPFHFVAGNHDVTNPVQAARYRERFGPTYYHFVRDGVLFLVLCSEDGAEARMSAEQIAYVQETVAQNPSVCWTLVFIHKPLWTYEGESGQQWAQVEQILGDRPYTVFCGHTHRYTKYERNGRDYYVLATTGGDSQLSGPQLGEFDEVVWVTMTDAGPRMANLALDGILPDDVATEASIAAIDAARSGMLVEVAPILVTGDTFESGETQIQFANVTDGNMHVTARFAANPLVSVEPSALEVTVPPETAMAQTLHVRADAPTPPSEIGWADVTWTIRLDKPVLEVTERSAIFFETPLACSPRAEPVVVDGDLSDWPELPFECSRPYQILHDPTTWHGPQDSKFRFGVAYDDQDLYIGVEATDDQPFYNSNRMPWQQDGIEVRLDARPDPERSAGHGGGEFTDVILVALSPAAPGAEMVVYGPTDQPTPRQAVCVATATGHNTEIAIPLSYLDGLQGGRWEAFRLNICVDDFEGPDDSGAQIWWRPDWRAARSYRGSGTSTRQ